MTSEQTTTTMDAGPPPPPPPPGATYPPLAALRRSRTDRKVAGVSGGLGRHFSVDPLIFRILFVVLTFFGGSGVLLYALGWLLLPADGEQESEGQRLLRGRSTSSVTKALGLIVVVLVAISVAGALVDTGPGIGGVAILLVVGAVGFVLLRNGNGGQRVPTTPPYAPAYGPVPPPEPGQYGQTPGTAYSSTAVTQEMPVPPAPPAPPAYAPPASSPPPPPPPPKERSVLGRVTVSTALIVVGGMIAWNAASSDDIRAVAILASALAVVAAGLLVGAVAGRARWLIALAIPLTIATSAAAVADDHLQGGVGTRDWAPLTVERAESGYELGIGEGQLDLSRLPAGSSADLRAEVGIGELRIIVPRDATVHVDGHVAAGVFRAEGHPTLEDDDLDAQYTYRPVAGTTSTGTVITVEAEVGFGELEVRRATS